MAGEKLFVDWAGDTIPVFDAATGEEHRAHIFVAALGASNYTYAEARWTETLPDWIGAHVNALAAIGGVPKVLVPDNLKAGITKPSRYEPGINRTYQDLADHYGCVVLPTRVMKPRNKATVEVAVQIVERFVLAKLRHRRFFSLAELNAAIRDCVAAINARIMRRVGTSRHELLEMNHDIQQEAHRVDQDVPLATFDLLARVVARRIERSPPFGAPFAVCESMIAAVGLASRPCCSRTAT